MGGIVEIGESKTKDDRIDVKPEKIKGSGLKRHFTKDLPGHEAELSVEDMFEWGEFEAKIEGADGRTVFEQKGIKAPMGWTNQAIKITANKYFRNINGIRESDVAKMFGRIVRTVGKWGREDGYFADDKEWSAFAEELGYILLDQRACFNSPVLFNVGIYEQPQCSACFILKVDDDMESILTWYRDEGIIFKYGSGSGINLSTLRSSKEMCSDGAGKASGPLSFMKPADANAGVIRSGGKTRRAAKMVILNHDHPDIEDFIWCKSKEEKKAHVLLAAGYSGGIDGEAYGSVFYQNANNSVRVTDDFMKLVNTQGGSYTTKAVTTGKPLEELNALRIFNQICEAAWECADPGMQFDTTINEWHTCPNSGRINASNPCGEYMHLDNSACNLASINLLKFLDEDGNFDIVGFDHTIDVMITAMDILIDRSSYPTAKITSNAHAFRELGLGYANLGASIMALGLPYDSDEGRSWAASVSALLTGRAYYRSAKLAAAKGPFEGFKLNREPMLNVINKHWSAMNDIKHFPMMEAIWNAADTAWGEAKERGIKHGYRNSQATVIAPTGTIAFVMDCDTTGIEPELALVKYKNMVGGGQIKIVNQTVARGMRKVGAGFYTLVDIERTLDYIREHDTIEEAPGINSADLPIFDCSFVPRNGKRCIAPSGHYKMMAAVQPFISGAISKTINMPKEATKADVREAYMESWKLGLKAVAIYRDGCKAIQPLRTEKDETLDARAIREVVEMAKPYRRKLDMDARAIRHKFDIIGHEGYIHVGLYDDGAPGEVFIQMNKEGSTISGLMQSFGIAISHGLQHGVPLDLLVRKFKRMRFEPSGFTPNTEIPQCTSIIDYWARWMELRFAEFLPPKEEDDEARARTFDYLKVLHESASRVALADSPAIPRYAHAEGSMEVGIEMNGNGIHVPVDVGGAPLCSECGDPMIPAGSCYRCYNCGENSGCG